jgi:hypothetical protein
MRFTKRTLQLIRREQSGPSSTPPLQQLGLSLEVERTPDLAGKLNGLVMARIIGWQTASDLDEQKGLAPQLHSRSPTPFHEDPLHPDATTTPRRSRPSMEQQQRAARIRPCRSKIPSSLLRAPARDEEGKPKKMQQRRIRSL